MKVQCIYYSGGGNTRLVVDEVNEILKSNNIEVNIKEAAIATAEDITDNDNIILACPTYDHGLLSKTYYDFLARLSDIDLSSKNIAIIGLGDSKYDQEHTVEAASILEKYVSEHNGKLVTKTLRINKSPIDRIEKQIIPWSEELAAKLSE